MSAIPAPAPKRRALSSWVVPAQPEADQDIDEGPPPSAAIPVGAQTGKISTAIGPDSEVLEVIPLGAGQEVGRSCIIVKFKGKTIMFDCGVHPALSGIDSLPYFDEIDLSTVDLCLISHFHVDHVGALPHLTERTTFGGRVFMTHPTKSIIRLLLSDHARVSINNTDTSLYHEADLLNCLKKSETLNYHQEVEHDGIRFWCYNAGHVLGAAMFLVEIEGVKILYTGDFSRHADRHLQGAETPHVNPDVVIVESTYGVQVHEARAQREERFTGAVEKVIRRGGRCLVPAFALGRAQELLLILEEFWQTHPDLQRFRVYYASALAVRCIPVFKTYINMMNARIRQQFAISNPFDFRFITSLTNGGGIDTTRPCVVLASPGMLQSGLSRELFDMWASDPRNGVIIPGFCVQGTMAKRILSEPPNVETLQGNQIPLRMSVHYISFSAHSDYIQTSEFLQAIHPGYVVLVHGERTEMQRLKHGLEYKFRHRHTCVVSPANGVLTSLVFRTEKTYKALGGMASECKVSDKNVRAVLVSKGNTSHLVSPDDLQQFSHVKQPVVRQRLKIPFTLPFELARAHLRRLFVGSKLTGPTSEILELPHGVNLVPKDGGLLLLWKGSPTSDAIADATIAALMALQSSPEAARAIPYENDVLIKDSPADMVVTKKENSVVDFDDEEGEGGIERQLEMEAENAKPVPILSDWVGMRQNRPLDPSTATAAMASVLREFFDEVIADTKAVRFDVNGRPVAWDLETRQVRAGQNMDISSIQAICNQAAASVLPVNVQ